jgi:cell division ATPase FtsA
VLTGGAAVMPGMVELAEDIFLKPVRKGIPTYHGSLHDMVANPRSATVMGLLEEARLARTRGIKAAQQAGSVKTLFGRAKTGSSAIFEHTGSTRTWSHPQASSASHRTRRPACGANSNDCGLGWE